ncbi:MAG: hypothetical protein ACREDM_12210 [Methylocella sp.]
MNIAIRQTTNKSYLIFAAGSLTVKHTIVDMAIKNITVAAKRLFACNGCFRTATL